MRPLSQPSRRSGRRSGFTLVELLVVLLIVGIIAAVTLPVVIPAVSHRQVSETAQIIQGGLLASRDAALRSNTPHGIRFLPDSTFPGIDPNIPGPIDPFRILASNRFIPIEQPPGYSSGRVHRDMTNQWETSFIRWPLLGNWGPAGPMPALDTQILYKNVKVLMVYQAIFQESSLLAYPISEEPTAWYWNIRVGDRIQVGGTGPFYTIVGPMDVDNPEKFVNVSSPPLQLDAGGMRAPINPEILFVVNGLDDDHDGYVDNGWDGIDNDVDGLVDETDEWAEGEVWPAALKSSTPAALIAPFTPGLSYTIIRQPVPSPGARETMLPSNVVVDLTGSLLRNPQERSRLPVDRLSGNVDILLNPNGQVVPTTRYSSPTSFGLGASFYHIWVAERSDLVAPNPSTIPFTAAPLISGMKFILPMPLGRNYQNSSGVGNVNAYDELVANNPLLPTLKGEMRLLTLTTRSGNLITTDRPVFNVSNPSQPFHAPQLGVQGDAP